MNYQPPLPIPWPKVLGWCVGSALIAVTLVAIGAVRDGGIERVLFSGRQGPGAAVLLGDMPDGSFLPGIGHDGQHFYVVARSLPHLEDAEDDLGLRPGYRFQRVGMPLLARVLHPWGGGGESLVVAMLVANWLGIVAGAIGVSVLVASRGGPPWVGAIFPWLPACLQGLQTSLADAHAAGFTLAALAAAERRQPVLAGALAVAAILGKEAIVVVFVGWGCWAVVRRLPLRTYLPFVLAVVPAALWFLHLRQVFPGRRLHGQEFVAPFTGFVDAFRALADGADGATVVGLAISVTVFVGLLLVVVLGDKQTVWPWIALALFAYQAVLRDSYWYKTINANRFTIAGAGVLLVVLGTHARLRATAR